MKLYELTISGSHHFPGKKQRNKISDTESHSIVPETISQLHFKNCWKKKKKKEILKGGFEII